MAPLKPAKKSVNDGRVQQSLDLAKSLRRTITERTPLPEGLQCEVQRDIERAFSLPRSTLLAHEALAFDAHGTQLWNAATNILRQEENQGDLLPEGRETVRLVALLRTFSFLLLDATNLTSSQRTKDQDQRIRCFKLANKACRFCLDHGEFELSLKIFQRSAEYVSATEEDAPILQIANTHDSRQDGSQRTLKNLTCEYYLLRMTHGWKTDRFDLADHFFSKVSTSGLTVSETLTERAAELFYEAGKTLAAAGNTETAVKWCERASSALDACNPEDLSTDTSELRLAIASTLVNVLLSHSGDAGNRARASAIVNQLDTTNGTRNRIAVTLMRFKILISHPPVNTDQLSSVVQHLIKLAVITDKTFKTIMQTIHKAKRHSTSCALAALQQLCTARLAPDLAASPQSDQTTLQRIEKAAITYIVFATSESGLSPTEATSGLQQMLDELITRSNVPFSAKATHAAQTLIWKTAGNCELSVTEDWLRLLRHPIFDSAGQLNKARIGRKAIVTALALNDSNAAREYFYGMPQAAQNEAISRYLAFKIALKSSDHGLAVESLQIVAKYADKDATFLYACVLDAQQSKKRDMAIAGLQALLDKQPSGTHLPSLLRCTSRLLIGELETREEDSSDVVEEVVQLFERAGANVKIFRQGTDSQWQTEIQWWSKNAYNLVLRLRGKIHPEHLIRLLAVCNCFLDCYPNDGSSAHADDVHRRGSLCHFISACALVVTARSAAEDSEQSRQSYLRVRQEIAGFRVCVEKIERSRSVDAEEAVRRATRLFEVLKLDLEAILRLQQWQELDQAVKRFLNFPGGDRWDSLADLALIVHEEATAGDVSTSATSRIPQLLEKCINEAWKKDKDLRRMSRWLRLTFTIYLEDERGGLALKIVEQAASIAERGYNGDAESYPFEELTWLATMAFNRAVDSLAAGDNGGCKTWADAALGLARWSSDNGALHANLTHKRREAEARVKARRL